MGITYGLRKLLLAALLLFTGLTLAAASPRGGITPTVSEQTIYTFCSQQPNCSDGAIPKGLIMDGFGGLYGAADTGGVHGRGAIFRLTPNDTGGGWTETVIYSFCASGDSCVEGSGPRGIVMDSVGNLYGTTIDGGGAADAGTVFRLTPNQSRTAWTETVLYSFCPQYYTGVCADGANPFAAPLIDAQGNLYGITDGGGGAAQAGVVFRLTPTSAGWVE